MKTLMTWIMALMLCACSAGGDISGDYAATHQGRQGPVDVRMTIEADGRGHLDIDGEQMPFQWALRSDVLTLHAREGAVLEGRRAGNDLRMDMPGVGLVLFVRRK